MIYHFGKYFNASSSIESHFSKCKIFIFENNEFLNSVSNVLGSFKLVCRIVNDSSLFNLLSFSIVLLVNCFANEILNSLSILH